MGSLATPSPVDVSNMGGRKNNVQQQQQQQQQQNCSDFRMPLHYPRYTKADYEAMPEWKLDCLLDQYGLPLIGNLEEKRRFAIDAFLWSP